MKNTYLAIVAVLALATAAALTPVAISQQVFAQANEIPSTPGSDGGFESETETEVEANPKCNLSGFSTCTQTSTSTLVPGL
jgi:hypothetical protein